MREDKVKILIKSQQIDIDDPSPYVIEFATDGKIKDDGDTVTIKYDEYLEEDTNSVAHTSLMFSRNNPGTVTLSRSGAVRSTCVFTEGERHKMLYTMDIGTLEFGVLTRNLQNTIKNKSGNIRMKYDTEVRGSVVKQCDFKITIKS
jgi:uncharacterized beta-barrel protein YwiB (DUF1934 family)